MIDKKLGSENNSERWRKNMREFIVTFYVLDEKNNPCELVETAVIGGCHGSAVESARNALREVYPDIETYQWSAIGHPAE